MEPAESVAERIMSEMFTSRSNGGNSTMTVHHDGRGTWIAVTCCLVMLTALGVGAFWISREFNRIDSVFNDLNDKDSVQDAYISKLRKEQQEAAK